MTTKATKKPILTLEDIEQIEDVTEQEFPVQAWDGRCVLIRSITKRQMKEIKKKGRDADGEADQDLVEKQIFMAGMVEPKVNDEAYEKLLDKSASAMESILAAIIENSNMGAEDVKKEERTFRS